MPRVRDSLPGRSPIWVDDGDDPRGVSNTDAIPTLVGKAGLQGVGLAKSFEGWVHSDRDHAKVASGSQKTRASPDSDPSTVFGPQWKRRLAIYWMHHGRLDA